MERGTSATGPTNTTAWWACDTKHDQSAVKIVLRPMWVTFTVGTQWLALGVRCRARRGEEKAEVSCWQWGEGEGDEMGTEWDWMSKWGTIRCLTTYKGMSYILWASRCPCGKLVNAYLRFQSTQCDGLGNQPAPVEPQTPPATITIEVIDLFCRIVVIHH